VNVVGREHLERTGVRRYRERVGVDAEEDGTVDPLLSAVLADRLRDGEDVRLVEGVVERRAAVAGSAEGDAFLATARVGLVRVVGRDEAWDIGEHRGLGKLTGTWVDGHRLSW
jgi:hypothetical protein